MSKKMIVIFSLIISMSMMVTVYAGSSINLMKETKLSSFISIAFNFFEKISLIPKENKITNLGLGDVNVDGIIDKADLTLLKKHINSGALLSDEGLENADLNADMNVDDKDVDILRRYLSGEITMLPYTKENGELPIPLYPDPIKKETDDVLPKEEKDEEKKEIKEEVKENTKKENEKSEEVKKDEVVKEKIDENVKEIIKDKVKIDVDPGKIEIIKPKPPIYEIPVQPKPKLEVM